MDNIFMDVKSIENEFEYQFTCFGEKEITST